MSQALKLKFAIEGLCPEEAKEVIYNAVLGEEWHNGFEFADGSWIQVYWRDDFQGGVQAVVHWRDCAGQAPRPVVRTRFTCDDFHAGAYVDAYYDGYSLHDRPLPYLTYDDVMAMKGLLSEVRVEESRNFGGSGIGHRVDFHDLPPGYEWGEHIEVSPRLLDLGHRVIEVYAFASPHWRWQPFHA